MPAFKIDTRMSYCWRSSTEPVVNWRSMVVLLWCGSVSFRLHVTLAPRGGHALRLRFFPPLSPALPLLSEPLPPPGQRRLRLVGVKDRRLHKLRLVGNLKPQGARQAHLNAPAPGVAEQVLQARQLVSEGARSGVDAPQPDHVDAFHDGQ